jgi:hypothetical protein
MDTVPGRGRSVDRRKGRQGTGAPAPGPIFARVVDLTDDHLSVASSAPFVDDLEEYLSWKAAGRPGSLEVGK